jgi:hypothetical protein
MFFVVSISSNRGIAIMIAASISTICLASILPGATGYDSASANAYCPRESSTKLAFVPGVLNVGNDGERVGYDSRLEQTHDGTLRYVYCITNSRKYRIVRVKWFNAAKPGVNSYFSSPVAPGQDLGAIIGTLSPNYVAVPRTLQIGRTANERETVVPATELTNVSDRNITLASSTTLEIAADPATEVQLIKGDEVDYKKENFLTISLQFVSTAKEDSTGTTEIANGLRVKFVGATEHIDQALATWPKYLRATDPNDSSLLLSKVDSPIGLALPKPKDEGSELSRVVIKSKGPIVERHGVIEITDGKISYGAFTVSYFGPKTTP